MNHLKQIFAEMSPVFSAVFLHTRLTPCLVLQDFLGGNGIPFPPARSFHYLVLILSQAVFDGGNRNCSLQCCNLVFATRL